MALPVDVVNALLASQPIARVCFSLNQPVRVIDGSQQDAQGVVISLVALEPEPSFLVELDNARDVHVAQSHLAAN